MRKRNLIYSHKKSVAELILTRLSNAQQYYVQTSFTKFRPNCKRKCGKYEHKFIDASRLSVVISWPSFEKLAETHIKLLSNEFDANHVGNVQNTENVVDARKQNIPFKISVLTKPTTVNRIARSDSVPNYARIGQEIRKLREEINSRPLSKALLSFCQILRTARQFDNCFAKRPSTEYHENKIFQTETCS